MGVQYGGQDKVCDRKEMIKRIRKVIDDLDNSNVEARCCCTNPEKPPDGKKVMTPQCLDGVDAVPQLVSSNKERYIWVPPPIDNRQLLDPSMSCYSATVANQFYNQGCKLDCTPKGENGAPVSHSHWWNAPKSGEAHAENHMGPDYCQDPSFVPPEPLGHMAWTNEPGGTCKHPQYCKAHCFDHTPEKDWSRHY